MAGVQVTLVSEMKVAYMQRTVNDFMNGVMDQSIEEIAQNNSSRIYHDISRIGGGGEIGLIITPPQSNSDEQSPEQNGNHSLGSGGQHQDDHANLSGNTTEQLTELQSTNNEG